MKNKLFLVSGILLGLASIFGDNLLGRPFDGLGYLQLTGLLIGITFFLFGLKVNFVSLLKRISIILFVMGIILLGLNIIGIFNPLRNKDINNGVKWVDGINRFPTVTYQYAIMELNKGDFESKELYARRLNNLIFSSTIHFWGKDEDENKKFNIILPFYENYLIYIHNLDKQYKERPYTFCNPYKAIERGVGICSQMAQIVVSVWDPRERKAHMVLLDGHVVSEVEIKDNIWWILDPDFGIVIDKSLNDIEDNPEIVYSYYKNGGFSEETALSMVSYYGKKGNKIITNLGICKEEMVFERLIWVIPAILISPYSLILIFHIATVKKYKFNKA